MAKYVIVVGGCYSGTGKGVAAASIGLLLRLRGHSATYIKFDPYLNVDAGIIRPTDHGELFVLKDGTETDMDLGHAERIMGITATKDNIATAGTLYKELIEEQSHGNFLGQTVQLTPHLTDKIQQRLLHLGNTHDIVIAEIGGTVGDSESFAFFEAIRQFKQTYRDDILIAMVAPIIWVNTIKEFKTKPLQNSVRELQRHGLQPDIIFCRVDRDVPEKVLDKISMYTNIKRENVFVAPDISKSIYQVPLEYYNRQVDDVFVDLLRLNRSACRIHKYKEVVEKYVANDLQTIEIGVFGKYDNGDEAYFSLKEALMHAGVANDVKVNITWTKSEELEKYKDNRGIYRSFENLHGIIIPGGFDNRGVEGKIKAIQYVREKKIPFFGICLGLQCAVIEFARNVLNLANANSLEFDANSGNPVVHYVEGQEGLKKKLGTMRLGEYDCDLAKDTIAFELYGKKKISERHRHRFEINDSYVKQFEEKGFIVSGRNPESGLIEFMELKKDLHPFFLGSQAHPEFKSKLIEPAPLFCGLVKAALVRKNEMEITT